MKDNDDKWDWQSFIEISSRQQQKQCNWCKIVKTINKIKFKKKNNNSCSEQKNNYVFVK